MEREYTEQNIQILEGLEAVRKRPGMYIGSTDELGLHHLIWEMVDNAVDEALNGYGKKITVTLEKDGSCTVADEGRGMPSGMHASGMNTLQVIFTVLHAGGKFTSEGGYKTAGGLHGVGASVVNALSEWLTVESAYGGEIVRMEFTDGGSKASQPKIIGATRKTGTTVRFKPDASIFKTVNFNYETICDRMREEAFLLSGITIIVNDKRKEKEASETYFFSDGMMAFIDYLNEGKSVLSKPVKISGDYEGIHVDVAFQFTGDGNYSESIYSFVNLVRTRDGGTHESGFKGAFTAAFNEYARKIGKLKAKEKLDGSDVREGLTAVLSLTVPENILQFEGQTKGKLGTPQGKPAVDNVISEKLAAWLEENREQSDALIDRMLLARQAREAGKKAREEVRKGKKSARQERVLSDKLSPANSKDSSIKELFLVEGDSAGGSAKQGRDSRFQAILPLRGKVLNTEKCTMRDIEKNEELNTLIYTIGAGVGSDFDYSDSHYNKIIIMTDADDDGSHIQILLLTFFYRYMRPLLEHGMVYIALPPLYKVSKGKTVEYCYDDE